MSCRKLDRNPAVFERLLSMGGAAIQHERLDGASLRCCSSAQPRSPFRGTCAGDAQPIFERNAGQAQARRVSAASARLEAATQEQLVLPVAWETGRDRK